MLPRAPAHRTRLVVLPPGLPVRLLPDMPRAVLHPCGQHGLHPLQRRTDHEQRRRDSGLGLPVRVIGITPKKGRSGSHRLRANEPAGPLKPCGFSLARRACTSACPRRSFTWPQAWAIVQGANIFSPPPVPTLTISNWLFPCGALTQSSLNNPSNVPLPATPSPGAKYSSVAVVML